MMEPSRFDIPILRQRAPVPGNGPRVSVGGRYERSGLDPQMTALGFEIATMNWVGELLHKHYRGHFWDVIVDAPSGIVTITIPVLLGNWKGWIHLDKLTPEAVMRVGGDILERFNLPRSNLDLTSFLAARHKRVSRANQRPPG